MRRLAKNPLAPNTVKHISIIAAIIVSVLGSCGGSAMYAARPESLEPVPTAPGTAPIPPDSHDQITNLEAEIEKDRIAMQLAAPAPTGRSAEPYYQLPETDPNCHPAKTDACTASCKLSASICRNAEK